MRPPPLPELASCLWAACLTCWVRFAIVAPLESFLALCRKMCALVLWRPVSVLANLPLLSLRGRLPRLVRSFRQPVSCVVSILARRRRGKSPPNSLNWPPRSCLMTLTRGSPDIADGHSSPVFPSSNFLQFYPKFLLPRQPLWASP